MDKIITPSTHVAVDVLYRDDAGKTRHRASRYFNAPEDAAQYRARIERTLRVTTRERKPGEES